MVDSGRAVHVQLPPRQLLPSTCPNPRSCMQPCCSDEALTPCERQLVAQTWERCQQQLFLHALQPHPLTAHVLGCVWSDLAAASSEALLKSHISALHDLLHVAAAAEAAGGHGPPSPLYSQLLGLLACLLAAAPAPTQDAFFAHFLQVGRGDGGRIEVDRGNRKWRDEGMLQVVYPFQPPSAAHSCTWCPQALGKMSDDTCQLACLVADLRLAALVDSASGSAAAAPQVQGLLATLFRWLTEMAPALMKRAASAGAGGQAAGSGPAEAETLYLAWLLEALHCTAAYFAATGGPQVSKQWAWGCSKVAGLAHLSGQCCAIQRASAQSLPPCTRPSTG